MYVPAPRRSQACGNERRAKYHHWQHQNPAAIRHILSLERLGKKVVIGVSAIAKCVASQTSFWIWLNLV